MYELVADYWWIFVFSVPALAIALKLIAERADLVDSLSAPLRRRLSSFDYSYPEHWVVTVTTRDGRRFSRVVINDRFRLDSTAALLFKLRDVADVAWEGFGEVPAGSVVQLSDGGRGAA